MKLKPCPFCGAEDLKHYVTAASGGGARGVVVCKSCGARLEAHNQDSLSLRNDGYNWKDAIAYQRAHAFDAVAEKWNNRPELFCALEYDMVDHCHVCDTCGERFEMSRYFAVATDGSAIGKPMLYCPSCGRKIAGV